MPAIALVIIAGCPLIECNWSLPSATNHYGAAIDSPLCLVLPGSIGSGVKSFLGAISMRIVAGMKYDNIQYSIFEVVAFAHSAVLFPRM